MGQRHVPFLHRPRNLRPVHQLEKHPFQFHLVTRTVHAAPASRTVDRHPFHAVRYLPDYDSVVVRSFLVGMVEIMKCRTYWGSHGCELNRGHDGPHYCGDEAGPCCGLNLDGTVRYWDDATFKWYDTDIVNQGIFGEDWKYS